MAEREAAAPTRPANRHVYYPGGAPQFEYTAVNLKNRSHTITADVEIPAGGAEGVLLAHGSWFAGYSLYVKDGASHYVHNYLGLAEYRISSTERRARRARSRLAFRFTRTGRAPRHRDAPRRRRAGRRGRDSRSTVPAVIETSGEGLCCGYDSGLPVTARLPRAVPLHRPHREGPRRGGRSGAHRCRSRGALGDDRAVTWGIPELARSRWSQLSSWAGYTPQGASSATRPRSERRARGRPAVRALRGLR